MDRDEAILVFVESVNRLGYTRDEIASELVSLVNVGCDWPKADRDEWLEVIKIAIAGGRLCVDRSGVVTLPIKESVVQLELF